MGRRDVILVGFRTWLIEWFQDLLFSPGTQFCYWSKDMCPKLFLSKMFALRFHMNAGPLNHFQKTNMYIATFQGFIYLFTSAYIRCTHSGTYILGRFAPSGFMFCARILGRFAPSGFDLHIPILGRFAPSGFALRAHILGGIAPSGFVSCFALVCAAARRSTIIIKEKSPVPWIKPASRAPIRLYISNSFSTRD